MKRKIINIDEKKCTGCGLCIANCPEGAIQIINGKARLVGDLFCDGLGACLGHCPEGAVNIEEREAEPYDEAKVMKNVVKQGIDVVDAHLKHLDDHGETGYLSQALNYLAEHRIKVNYTPKNVLNNHGEHFGGCPGAKAFSFDKEDQTNENYENRVSHLGHWPVQLHLISPASIHYKNSDLLIAADCTAYAAGDFHKDFLKGKTLAIACPKLDEGLDSYVEKITALIDEAKVNTITVVIMQVPCCGGLVHLVQKATDTAHRKVPVKCIVLNPKGEVLSEEWL